MPNINTFDDATTRDLIRMVRYMRATGLWGSSGINGGRVFNEQTPIFVRNDEEEDIPAFACMQTTGTVEFGGQNYLTVVKPVDDSGASGKYLFNSVSVIEEGGYGVAYAGPEARMLTDGSTVTCGASWQPEMGEWAVTPGGSLFTAIGEDDIAADVMRGFIVGSGSSSKLFLTPVGGIAARAGTTVSSATCTEYKIVTTTLTTNTVTATVFNPWPVAIPASYYILAAQEAISSKWIAMFPGVINVRWDDPDLEQTLDGTNYLNIDTAEDC